MFIVSTVSFARRACPLPVHLPSLSCTLPLFFINEISVPIDKQE